MNKHILKYTTLLLAIALTGCSERTVRLAEENLTLVNREILAIDNDSNAVKLNNSLGDGLAIIKDVNFDIGTLDVSLRGEDLKGKSFVGVAFNVQNESTYEAVYFRPFNFRSEEATRRAHSLQYIYHPKYTWRFLRTNHEGHYEGKFPRRPNPNNWFNVQVIVTADSVFVYDKETNGTLLAVERLTEQVSNNIALWTGFDSKGEFKDLTILN